MNKKKVLIIAPFFNSNTVGVYRINRFIDWLSDDYSITVLSVGISNNIEEKKWGKNVIVKDFFEKVSQSLLKKKFLKPLFIIWNIFLYYFIIPDQYYFWAKNINKKFDENGFDFIISSSPQNSSHLAARILSSRLDIPFIADFRDGWIDEPLRIVTSKWKWRNQIERKMEENIIKNASIIFVTSTKWKEMLTARYKNAKKVFVLTNAYPKPEVYQSFFNTTVFNANEIKIIYTGNFTAFRKQKFLFEPLISFANETEKKIILTLLGSYRKKDKIEFQKWEKISSDVGFTITVRNFLPREKMFRMLGENNGLILFSASYGAVPSKLFEYIPLKKPILAITQKNGAVWEICKNIPQVFLFDYLNESNENFSNLSNFFFACSSGEFNNFKVPVEFTEDFLKKTFMESLSKIDLQLDD